MSNEEMNQKVFQLMSCMKLDDDGSQIVQYMLFGEEICRQAFCTLLGINVKRVQRLMTGLKSGHVPDDLRRMNAFMGLAASQVSISEVASSVDDYLHFVYQYLAEPLAETDEPELNLQVAALVELEGVEGLEDQGPVFDTALPEHAMADTNPVIEGLLNVAGLGPAERRFMQWKTWTTFYDEYKIWCSSNVPRLRLIQRSDAVMDFRQIQGRLNSMSEQSTCCGSVPSGGGILKVDMDYCDQSKFRVVECYFLYEADMVKNPGTEFSMMAMGLDEAETDFIDRIQSTMKPVRGRELVVKMVTGSYDFSVFFGHLGVQIAGLDLPKFHRATETSWTVDELEKEEYSAAPNDAIMLVKEWVSSTCLSQPPQLILPSSFLDRLKDVALAPNGRNMLPQRTADEFLKSAKMFGSEPWNLTEAENYLTAWVDANQRGVHPAPPQLKFIWVTASHLDLWKEYAPGDVRVVTATARPKAKAASAKANPKAVAKAAAAPKAVPKNKAKAKAKAVAAGNQRGQKRPAPDQGNPDHEGDPPAAADPRGRFGCSKCRYSRGGCRQCRDPAYQARRHAVR
ncbi:unnamed protein product [Symbiodinium sp. CCMP2592]|nr:unnamed protein product [Symbiodinium sp. CCMP2592]